MPQGAESNKTNQTSYSITKASMKSREEVACRTGLIFLHILGEQRGKQGECKARVVREVKSSSPRLPCFHLCSPKIRKKPRLFCRLGKKKKGWGRKR